jgi:hypothetical protein
MIRCPRQNIIGWQRLQTGCKTIRFAGNHLTIHSPLHFFVLALTAAGFRLHASN